MNTLDQLAPGELAEGRPYCPYEPLIGSWNVSSRWFADDGSTRETATGEWHFEWILGGWAVQDVLFVTGAPADQRGTSVRSYDETTDSWRSVWITPGAGYVALSSATGEMIVQELDEPEPGQRERWTISEITPASFVWRDEISGDDGLTWELSQEMHAVRSR